MTLLHEQGLKDLARASSAAGRIIEAHSDKDDQICRVVIEMSEGGLRNAQLREAVLQLWMADGFIASISRDGQFLMIDGLIGQPENAGLDLINTTAEQIKCYTRSAIKQSAAQDTLTNSAEMAFLASAIASESPHART